MLILLLIKIILIPYDFSNEISSLRTTEGVEEFVKRECDRYQNKYIKVLKWKKADIDDDKNEDLIFETHDGYQIVAFYRFENNFEFKELPNFHNDCCPKWKIIKIDKQALIIRNREQVINDTGAVATIKDTIIYKHNYFLNYCSKPGNYNIEEISFEALPTCLPCPPHKLVMNKANNNYLFEKYADDGKYYIAEIDSNFFNKAQEILNYANFPMFADKYSDYFFDVGDNFVIIKYDGDKEKTIVDHGRQGNYSLIALYNLIMKNKNWKLSNRTQFWESDERGYYYYKEAK